MKINLKYTLPKAGVNCDQGNYILAQRKIKGVLTIFKILVYQILIFANLHFVKEK